MNGDVQLVVAAGDLVAEVAGGVSLVDGLLQHLDLGGVFTADVNIGFVAVDGVGTDDDALDEQVRVLDQDVAVLEGGRLGFVGVDRQVDRFAGVLGEKAPFDPGGKAGPAAATQPASLDLVDDVFRFGGKELVQRLIGPVLLGDLEGMAVFEVEPGAENLHLHNRSPPTARSPASLSACRHPCFHRTGR
jgi:hypothetical protein